MSVEAGRATTPEAGESVRRVRLPNDRRTPAAARAVVRSVLEEAGLEALLNEALLLTTELSTNAVVHAGTELDIEVAADHGGLTVTVTDFAPGPVEQLAVGPRNDKIDIGEVAERGRGLLLVDHFASRWGTVHQGVGKGVWFRLERRAAHPPEHAADQLHPAAADHVDVDPAGDRSDPTGDQFDPAAERFDPVADLADLVDSSASRTGPAGPPASSIPSALPIESAPSSDPPSVGALTMLLQLDPERHVEEGLADFASDLLARLARLTGAAGGVVRVDRGDGGGRQQLARYGRPPREDAATIRVPLTVHRPYAGELELDASPTDYARPLAFLVAERLSLHLENDRLRRADVRRQTWLTFLAEASELLAQSLDVNLTMALIPQLVVPRLGQWCAVHTTDAWGRLQLAAATHADEADVSKLHATLSETGPESVLARLAEVSRLGGQVLLGPPSEGFAVPLVARGQRLGTLAVGRHVKSRHDADEVAVLEDVARRAALAIDNARIHDERQKVARTLQQSLLPPVLPLIDGIGIAAEYVPTGAEVGGDFYDVVPLPSSLASPSAASQRDGGRWLVVVGDVSGKGVQAATVTGLVRDVIRILADDGKPMTEVLARVNRTLVQRGGGRYCTLAMASVERHADGNIDVSLHLAGHDRPVHVRADGRAAFVGEGGTALGLLEAISSPAVSFRLAPGDSLVFYTDGVTERRRGRELFGTERLRAAVRPLAGYAAEVVAARLRSATINFSVESPRDDIAILVLRNDT